MPDESRHRDHGFETGPSGRRGEATACEVMGAAYDELGQKPEAPSGFAALGLKYLDHACSMRDAGG